MSTTPRRLGPYELDTLVGEGGTGEVWKARDTRSDRVVAIKRLRVEVPSRFEHEARALSALSHPHICALYDVGDDNGTPFLVMEYVEGRPLAGPLPIREALRYAIQIADALSAAHRAGIVHRALEPANVLIHGTAGVKLLDFGLAPLGGSATASRSADTMPATAEVTLASTLRYMAPEQLEGRPADARSDIFAFGVLLYELLTGHRAFDAKSQAGLTAAVMDTQPPPAASLAKDVPPALERLVRRAIEKNPERRWQTMEAVKDALEWVADNLSAAAPAGTSTSINWRWALVAGALVLAAVAGLGVWAVPPATRPERLQVEVALPSELAVGHESLISIAPNGRSILVNASKALWLRSLEDGSLRALPGVTGATLPFWSPDGLWVAFFADGKLKKMQLPDATPVVLAEAPNPRGGTWSASGTIVFAPQALGPLMKVPAGGGTPQPVTSLDQTRQEDQHSAPAFLPDGRRFLYHARSLLKDNTVLALGAIDGRPDMATRAVVAADTGGWYAPGLRGDGYVLFLRRRNLFVQRFDATSGSVSGEATVLAHRVRVMADAVANVSVGAKGQVVYVTDEPRVNQPRWYSRDGSLIRSLGDLGEYTAARLSPSAHLVATVRADPMNFARSVWILDVARNVDTQITVDGNIDDPVWSPDTRRLALAWSKPGEEAANVYEIRTDHPGIPRPLVKTGAIRWPLDWSPDGRLLLYAQIDPISKFDLWVVPVDGSGEPQPVVTSPGKDNEARFSPDGAFVAYQTDEAKESRVYVTPYPPTGRQIPISDGSGGEPRWRRDGRELYYVTLDGALMAVPIAFVGGELRPGRPVRLFGGRDSSLRVWHFDPSADGQQFLVLSLSENAGATPVHLLTGWQ